MKGSCDAAVLPLGCCSACRAAVYMVIMRLRLNPRDIEGEMQVYQVHSVLTKQTDLVSDQKDNLSVGSRERGGCNLLRTVQFHFISLYFGASRLIPALLRGAHCPRAQPTGKKIAARWHERQGAVSNGRSNVGAVACDAMHARQIQHATGHAL